MSGATVRENGSTNVVSFEYDHQGMRVAATVNGQETRFLLDTTQQRYAQVIEEYLANGSLSRSYSYGRDLLSQDDTSTRSYYQVDGLGSTRQITDASGNVTLSYDYQAFGELLQKVGSGDNRFLFAGEQFDESVDLTYLRARYYDMGSGRFTTEDPFEGSGFFPDTLHNFKYANNNPVTNTDPSGRLLIEFILLRGANDNQRIAVQIMGGVLAITETLFLQTYAPILDSIKKGVPGASSISGTAAAVAFLKGISQLRLARWAIETQSADFAAILTLYASALCWLIQAAFDLAFAYDM
jgi:RHS repeat-associated protein